MLISKLHVWYYIIFHFGGRKLDTVTNCHCKDSVVVCVCVCACDEYVHHNLPQFVPLPWWPLHGFLEVDRGDFCRVCMCCSGIPSTDCWVSGALHWSCRGLNSLKTLPIIMLYCINWSHAVNLCLCCLSCSYTHWWEQPHDGTLPAVLERVIQVHW